MNQTKLQRTIVSIILLVITITSQGFAAAQSAQESEMIKYLIDQVDAAYLRQTIEQLQDNKGTSVLDDDGTRFTPSLNATLNLRYLKDRFSDYGLDVDVDTFFPTDEDCESIPNGMDEIFGCPPDLAFQNLIATLKGDDSSQYVLVTAHYDSINHNTEGWSQDVENTPAPGANDNASGVAIMLETARVLSKSKLNYDIKFVAFAAEEWGFLGSKQYVREALKNNEKIVGFINLDMVGLSDKDTPHIYVYYLAGSSDSEQIAQEIKSINQAYEIMKVSKQATDACPEEFSDISKRSDHVPFWDNGFTSGVYFGASGCVQDFSTVDPTYHTDGDVLYNENGSMRLSAAQMESLTQLTVASIADFSQLYETNPPPEFPSDPQQDVTLPSWNDLLVSLNEIGSEIELWFASHQEEIIRLVQNWITAQINKFNEFLQEEAINMLDRALESLNEICVGSMAIVLIPALLQKNQRARRKQ
jgi:hypothetical protein